MFACKDENVEFSALRFIIRVTPLDVLQENKKNDTFPGSEGFIDEEKLDFQIWFV